MEGRQPPTGAGWTCQKYFYQISSQSTPHGTKLNCVEMVRKQQSGLNINGTPLRINWANFNSLIVIGMLPPATKQTTAAKAGEEVAL